MSTGAYESSGEYYSRILADFPAHEKIFLAHFQLGRAYHAQGKKILYNLYATPEHLASLAKLGPCRLHRRSFAPVRAHLDAGLKASDADHVGH
jgi:hypothetical protein